MDWLTSTVTTLREWLASLNEWFDWLPRPVTALLIIAVALLVALAVHAILRRLLRRLLARRSPFLVSVFGHLRGITRVALLLIAVMIAIPVAPIGADTAFILTRVLLIVEIALIGWTAVTALHIGADLYLRRFRVDTEDNLLARKHLTQVRVLVRTFDVLLVIFTVGAALMTFPAVRQYGVSLFASAGVAGLIAGLAARPVLSNLFAGVQLAMTQPIRIDDAVIVENEFGTIEEITSTYVVVKLWDLRRMVVPLSYFIEKPFQNWTRETSTLVANALFYLDYRAPIDAMRRKLEEIVAASKNWDGKTCVLQVTNCKNTTIEVRALMSAPSAGKASDLRSEVLEKMIGFLQQEHPEALPVTRQERAEGERITQPEPVREARASAGGRPARR